LDLYQDEINISANGKLKHVKALVMSTLLAASYVKASKVVLDIIISSFLCKQYWADTFSVNMHACDQISLITPSFYLVERVIVWLVLLINFWLLGYDNKVF
jgi:hypothetical protein